MNYIGITEADFGKNIYIWVSEKRVADRIQSRNSEVSGNRSAGDNRRQSPSKGVRFFPGQLVPGPGKYGYDDRAD